PPSSVARPDCGCWPPGWGGRPGSARADRSGDGASRVAPPGDGREPTVPDTAAPYSAAPGPPPGPAAPSCPPPPARAARVTPPRPALPARPLSSTCSCLVLRPGTRRDEGYKPGAPATGQVGPVAGAPGLYPGP